jgi:hypothetical protein
LAIQQESPPARSNRLGPFLMWILTGVFALPVVANMILGHYSAAMAGAAAVIIVAPITKTVVAKDFGVTLPIWVRLGGALALMAVAGALLPVGASPSSIAEAPQAVANAEYRPMSLTDFKLDASQMRGEKVELQGYYFNLGGNEDLGREVMDSTPVPVNTDYISRAERKALLECDPPCHVTMRGKVGHQEIFGWGLMVYSVTID